MTGKRKEFSSLFSQPGMIFPFIVFLCLCLCFTACDRVTRQTDTEDKDTSFRKIYDKSDLSIYNAVDIKKTPDGGFIILGKCGEVPYLLRVDKNGKSLWDTDPETCKDYGDPIPELLVLNQDYYFFCIKKTGSKWAPVLLKFNEEEQKLIDQFELSFKAYPLTGTTTPSTLNPIRASGIAGYGFILTLSDNYWQTILITKVNTKGESEWEREYTVTPGCFYSNPPTDERLHIVGKVENKDEYYFQTYSKVEDNDNSNFPMYKSHYSSSSGCFMVASAKFKDNTVSKKSDLVKPFIAMEWHGSEGENIIISGARIADEIISIFVNHKISGVDEKIGFPQPELIVSKPVYIETISLKVDNKEEDVVFFAGTSKTFQIQTYFYRLEGEEEEKFLGEMIFGEVHIYEPAGLTKTQDGGLAILGNATVAARMDRICLFKLSKEEMEGIINE